MAAEELLPNASHLLAGPTLQARLREQLLVRLQPVHAARLGSGQDALHPVQAWLEDELTETAGALQGASEAELEHELSRLLREVAERLG